MYLLATQGSSLTACTSWKLWVTDNYYHFVRTTMDLFMSKIWLSFWRYLLNYITLQYLELNCVKTSKGILCFIKLSTTSSNARHGMFVHTCRCWAQERKWPSLDNVFFMSVCKFYWQCCICWILWERSRLVFHWITWYW